MSAIKKAYQEVVAFLQENKDKKVNTILEDVITMCSAKSAGGSATSFARNDAGEVVAVRCGYFGQWFLTEDVEFGVKQGTASGLSPMSKEGTSNYTRQQREYRAAKEALLQDVVEGTINAGDVAARLEELEKERRAIQPHSANAGFATLEEALAELATRG